MDEKKQIEEMANCCTYYHNGECCAEANNICRCDLMCEMFGVFANLTAHGYLKPSEGEWIKEHIYSRNWDDHYNLTCSVCGAVIIDAPKEYKYCHECGAKMKGGEEG
jgi:hypothetical protein